jgi:hypothetical protein
LWRDHLLDLRGRDLRGAVFQGATLTKTDFTGANLQGAVLDYADLRGASFLAANLRGASFESARLEGASFYLARLEEAWLVGAQLQAVSLAGAQLQGALLDGAGLQGASLSLADLQGASLKGVFVWRAEVRQNPNMRGARVESFELRPKQICRNIDTFSVCDWSLDEFKESIAKGVPDGSVRRLAVERLDPSKPVEGEEDMANLWARFARSSPLDEAYQDSLSQRWLEGGCDAEGAPYVIHGLLRRLSPTNAFEPFVFSLDAQHRKVLAAKFLDEANCPGARKLSNADKAALNAIRDGRGPKAPDTVAR